MGGKGAMWEPLAVPSRRPGCGRLRTRRGIRELSMTVHRPGMGRVGDHGSMGTNVLFTMALGLQAPWEVKSLGFNAADRRLDILVDFQRGSSFPCPVCGQSSEVHDTEEKTWQHLTYFSTSPTSRSPALSESAMTFEKFAKFTMRNSCDVGRCEFKKTQALS